MIVYMIVKHHDSLYNGVYIYIIYEIRHNYSKKKLCQLEAMAYLELDELAIFTYCFDGDSCGYPLVNIQQKTMENHHTIFLWVLINYLNGNFQVRKLFVYQRVHI